MMSKDINKNYRLSHGQNLQNLVTIKAQPIIATNNIDCIPKYRNLSTIIYIWGVNPVLFDSVNKNEKYWKPSIYRSLAGVKILSVSCSECHMLFLSCYCTVYTMGHGEYGQLGLGETLINVTVPTLIDGLFNVKQIESGKYHSIALTGSGKLLSWGRSDRSGHSEEYIIYAPKEILTDSIDTGTGKHKACKCVSAGDRLTIAACDEGRSLYIWGMLYNGEIVLQPKLFYSFPNDRIKQLAVGDYFALALTEGGYVYNYGDGTYGEFIGNSAFIHSSSIPIQLNNMMLKNIIKIAVGKRFALLVDKYARLLSFGDNTYGQCGISQSHHSPPTILDFSESKFGVTNVYCGSRHSACINNGNQLYTWGHSSHHKLIFTTYVDTFIQQDEHPGISVTSGFKNSSHQPHLIYSLLHEKISCVGLGPDYTVVVVGDGEHISTITSEHNITE